MENPRGHLPGAGLLKAEFEKQAAAYRKLVEKRAKEVRPQRAVSSTVRRKLSQSMGLSAHSPISVQATFLSDDTRKAARLAAIRKSDLLAPRNPICWHLDPVGVNGRAIFLCGLGIVFRDTA